MQEAKDLLTGDDCYIRTFDVAMYCIKKMVGTSNTYDGRIWLFQCRRHQYIHIPIRVNTESTNEWIKDITGKVSVHTHVISKSKGDQNP